MSEPVEFQILLNMQTALQGIAVVDGYYVNVDPTAVRLDPDVDVEALIRAGGLRPFIYLQPKPEEWQYLGMPNGLQLKWPVVIHWVQSTDPADDAARAQAFFRGCADVERAITRDLSRGGLATDHKIVTRTFNLSEDGSEVWAEIETMVTVNRRYGQP